MIKKTSTRHRVMIAALFACSSFGLNGQIEKSNLRQPPWVKETRATMEEMAENLTATLKPWSVPDLIINVDDYGAIPDGITVNTIAIQKAIDLCSENGGGVVRFSMGDYVTGTILFKSNVMLEIAQGAQILGSTSINDYPHISPQLKSTMETLQEMSQSLIYAEGVENIGIRGKGVIDGRGERSHFPFQGNEHGHLKLRPFVIRMYDSKNILIEDVQLMNSASWMQQYMNCENMIIQRMKVDNHKNRNNDGLDIDGCRRVWIHDCIISSTDDALCLKGNSMLPMEDILVENCEFLTHWNSFKIGTDTQGDFRRVLVRNCTLSGIAPRYNSSGILIASVDGGIVEDLWFDHNTIDYSHCPVFAVRNLRGRVMEGLPIPEIGEVRRVIIENTTGENNFNGGAVSGIPEFPVENIFISNFHLGIEGFDAGASGLRQFTQIEKHYESNTTYPHAGFLINEGFGWVNKALPARGFTLRDCKGIAFNNIIIRSKNLDNRPLFYLDNNVEATGVD